MMPRKRWRSVALAGGALLAFGADAAAQPRSTEQRVTWEHIAEIMRAEREKGYELRSPWNAVRLQAAVVIALARWARADSSDAATLLVHHEDYYRAYLDMAGISEAEVPEFMRAPRTVGEDLRLELRRDSVVRKVSGGPSPDLAVSVCASWEAPPTRFSYEDTTATPRFRSYHEHVNSYRVLAFGDDIVAYDDVRGIGGRATSGVAGLVFDILGEARAVRTVMGFATDGSQVSRTTARKLLTVSRTATVHPDGRLELGVPAGRPDLDELARKIERMPRIEYVPLRCPPPRDAESGPG